MEQDAVEVLVGLFVARLGMDVQQQFLHVAIGVGDFAARFRRQQFDLGAQQALVVGPVFEDAETLVAEHTDAEQPVLAILPVHDAGAGAGTEQFGFAVGFLAIADQHDAEGTVVAQAFGHEIAVAGFEDLQRQAVPGQQHRVQRKQRQGLAHRSPQRGDSRFSMPSWSSTRLTTKSIRSSTLSTPW